MELPCVTHRAEPTAPNRGTAREKPASQNLQGKILLGADVPSYPVHCTYLATPNTCRGDCSPPKAPMEQQPCSLGHEAQRKHWEGAGTWPHPIHALNVSGAGRGAGELREAGMWLRAHCKCSANHNTGSSPVLWDSGTTSSLILQSAQQLSPLTQLQGLCGSAPHHRGFCRLITCKIQLIGQSR